MQLHKLSLNNLVARCRAETRRFRRGQPSDEQFCLELFRRAVVARQTIVWAKLQAQYQSQVRIWICRYTAWLREPDLTEMICDTFTRFWEQYTPEKFARAQGLRSVLAYLQACARTEVHRRTREQEQRALEIMWDDVPQSQQPNAPAAETVVVDEHRAAQLWHAVTARCHDERDLLIAELLLVRGRKPRQIYAAYPELFTTIEELYQRKRNLRERLQRDPRIQEFL